MELYTGQLVEFDGYVTSQLYEPMSSIMRFEFSPDRVMPSHLATEGFPTYGCYRYLWVEKHAPTSGIVLGWTYRNVGRVFKGAIAYSEYGKEWEPGSMDVEERIKVWMIMPISGQLNRYCKPLSVLPEQIVRTANDKGA